MITITQSAVGYEPAKFYGLSADTKPTVSVPNGAEFNEIDTGKRYLFDAANSTWHEQPA